MLTPTVKDQAARITVKLLDQNLKNPRLAKRELLSQHLIHKEANEVTNNNQTIDPTPVL